MDPVPDQFFRFRIDKDMRRLLNRLHDEKDITLSRWVQRQVRNALQREFPDDEATETPKKPEPPQTPTIGTREVHEPGLATTDTPKKPPSANGETREPEPRQTPTIGTREVHEAGPANTEAPKGSPVGGWKPRRLDGGEWGAVIEGAPVAKIPDSDRLPGTEISVTDSVGDSWTTTIVAVVSRSDAEIVVTNTGRPRD